MGKRNIKDLTSQKKKKNNRHFKRIVSVTTLRKHDYSNILKNFQPKNEKIKFFDIFHISAQNIDCGYSLEPPR